MARRKKSPAKPPLRLSPAEPLSTSLRASPLMNHLAASYAPLTNRKRKSSVDPIPTVGAPEYDARELRRAIIRALDILRVLDHATRKGRSPVTTRPDLELAAEGAAALVQTMETFATRRESLRTMSTFLRFQGELAEIYRGLGAVWVSLPRLRGQVDYAASRRDCNLNSYSNGET